MIFLVLVIVALAAVSFVAIGVAFANKNRFPSNLISWCTVRKNTSIRGHFMRYQWTKDLIDLSKLPCNHSHPDAAGERDELSLRVTDFIEKTNGLRYDISMSRREIRSGVDGERFYYSPGDLSCPVMQSEITDNHVVTLCDVDYYLTETEFVGKVFGRKVLMNTFVPSALSGTIPNGRFHYVDANTVETVINGGARYYHKLYEYDKSFLTIRQWPRICFYNVDIVVINEHRNVVLLTPFAITFDPFGFAWWWLEAGRYSLRHDHVTRHGNVLTSRYLRDKKYYRSMMTVGDTVSVEIPERTFLAIKILFDVAKSSNVSDVEKFLRLQKFTPLQSAEFAPIIFRTLKQIGIDSTLSVGASTSVGDSDSTWSVGTAAPAYDTVVDGGLATDNEVRACNVSVVPPVVLNGGPSPVESYNNDLACVQQRVIAPHNVLEPDGLQCYAKEFLELLVRIDVVGCGVPWTSDSVMEKQDRPLQRHRSELQRHWRNDFLVVKAFQKKETYAKVSAPRNISTVTPSHTVGLSRFTYPFKKNILDYFDWYMPCRAPCEIVRRVRNYVQHRETVDCTDYSSFDGTNSRWLRENVELAAYLRWYPSEYHNEIRGYINAELDAAAVTSHGVRYKPDGSRLSGSPLTTDGNTMLNAFASYCGYRLAGFEPKRSFNTIGPKYGDDSIEDVRCQLDEVCRRIGFSIKHEVVTALSLIHI